MAIIVNDEQQFTDLVARDMRISTTDKDMLERLGFCPLENPRKPYERNMWERTLDFGKLPDGTPNVKRQYAYLEKAQGRKAAKA